MSEPSAPDDTRAVGKRTLDAWMHSEHAWEFIELLFDARDSMSIGEVRTEARALARKYGLPHE